MTISTPSPLLNRLEATPVINPLCQNLPSPMTAIGRLSMFGVTAAALASDMPQPRIELQSENGANVAKECQPMSALICDGPSSPCISLMAEKTGPSGQPVQN